MGVHAKRVLITPLWDPRTAKHGSHERVLEMTPRNGGGGCSPAAQQEAPAFSLWVGGGAVVNDGMD